MRPAVLRVCRNADYDEALSWQMESVALLKRDPDAPETVWLVEHTPTVTLGASGDGRHVLSSPERMEADGVAYRKARRGGDATYHGPGQWTVYPILRLETFCKDLHRYMRRLEEGVIQYLAGHGIDAGRVEGKTGVWVGRGKLAAVGVAVSRWISFHGVAVNIQPDLAQFRRHIVPCGISSEDGAVTSLRELTGKTYDMEEEALRLAQAIGKECELELRDETGNNDGVKR